MIHEAHGEGGVGRTNETIVVGESLKPEIVQSTISWSAAGHAVFRHEWVEVDQTTPTLQILWGVTSLAASPPR